VAEHPEEVSDVQDSTHARFITAFQRAYIVAGCVATVAHVADLIAS
jgi:hypothetical protein